MARNISKTPGKTGSAVDEKSTTGKGDIPEDQRKEAARIFAMAVENHRKGRLDLALKGYARALSLNPTMPDIFNNMGVALRAQGKVEAAIACYRRSLALSQDDPGVYSNLGNALRDAGKLELALASHQKAIKLSPQSAQPIYNLGLVLRDLGRNDKAMTCFAKAVALMPDYADCHYDYALSLLLNGDLKAGFEQYEWRWKLDRVVKPNHQKPRWDGSKITEQTILLQWEQGFSDVIQFARYIPLVAERANKVIVECQPELVSLIKTVEGVDEVIASGSVFPAFDLYAPLLSVPRILGTTPGTIPDKVPYVFPPALHGVHLPLSNPKLKKVGICWAGKPSLSEDNKRSAPFSYFIDLMGLPGAAFFSLQKGARAEDLQDHACDALAFDMGPRLEDFSDTAAVIKQLDLVVTVDTAVAHLAGALGKPVWILLPYSANWRWMTGVDKSPWYPTARLFRQKAIGDWDGVFKDVLNALRDWMQKDKKPRARRKPRTTRTSLSVASNPE